jgi:hypothetical protein
LLLGEKRAVTGLSSSEKSSTRIGCPKFKPLLRYVSHAHPELAAGLTAGNPIKLIYMGGLPTETLANHELSQTTIEHRTVTEEM